MGFPDVVLLNEAGKAQLRDTNTNLDWGKPGPTLLPWIGDPPYGDDPKDQYWIQQGIDYYRNREHWRIPQHSHPLKERDCGATTAFSTHVKIFNQQNKYCHKERWADIKIILSPSPSKSRT